MRRLLLTGSGCLLLSGCQGEFILPWQGAQLAKIDMLGITISWPVIAVPALLLLGILFFKLKAIKRDNKK